MIKGMESSPLAHILLQKHMGASTHLPSMNGPRMPNPSAGLMRLGKHVNQPKIKPLASGFRMASMMPRI